MAKAMIAAVGAALIALAVTGFAWSDDDDNQGGKDRGHGREGKGLRLAAVTNERYRTECGGCHLAYPPGLMPAAAWGQVMGTLNNHFGDDASLEPAVVDELLAYLQGNATDGRGRGRSTNLPARPAKGGEPPRLTESAYFQRKHDEVPARYVKGNPKVGSFSNCAACHPGADKGNFDEHQVIIAGIGRFED